jgi:hypothetical protein
MTPDPFFRVVVQRRLLPAKRTAKRRIGPVIHPDVHPTLGVIQFNPAHKPRLSEPQNLLVKLRGLHPPMLQSAEKTHCKPGRTKTVALWRDGLATL